MLFYEKFYMNIDSDVASNVMDATKIAASVLATLATLGSFGLLVFNAFDLTTSERILSAGLLGMLYWNLILSIVTYTLWQRPDQKKEHLTYYYLAATVLLSDDEQIVDETNRYSYVEKEMDLRGDEVTYDQTYEGTNVASQTTDQLTLHIDSETILGNGNWITASQYVDGQWNEVETELERLNRHETLIRIPFHRPLEPGESFKIRIRMNLGEWDTSSGQYIYYDTHRLTRGIANANFSVIVDREPEVVEAFEVVNFQDMIGHKDPERLDFEINPINTVIESKKDGTVYRSEAKNVKDTFFIFGMGW